MFETLIGTFLPGLKDTIAKKLLGELESAGRKIAVKEVAKLTARGLVKGIDAFAKVTVKHLSPSETLTLTGAYVAALQDQIAQLADAAAVYAPLAIDVELAKKQFGSKSVEANAARKVREIGMAEMREEVRDVLLVAIGDEPVD